MLRRGLPQILQRRLEVVRVLLREGLRVPGRFDARQGALRAPAAAAAAAAPRRLASLFSPFGRRDVLLRPGRALGLGAGLRRRRHGVELGRGGPARVVGHAYRCRMAARFMRFSKNGSAVSC